MPTQIPASGMTATSTFTPAQWQVLQELRARYSATGDHLGPAELARLRFVRWLYQTGRLQP